MKHFSVFPAACDVANPFLIGIVDENGNVESDLFPHSNRAFRNMSLYRNRPRWKPDTEDGQGHSSAPNRCIQELPLAYGVAETVDANIQNFELLDRGFFGAAGYGEHRSLIDIGCASELYLNLHNVRV